VYKNNSATNITVAAGTGTVFYIDNVSGSQTTKVVAGNALVIIHVISGATVMYIK
jgi:hypothetical protein